MHKYFMERARCNNLVLSYFSQKKILECTRKYGSVSYQNLADAVRKYKTEKGKEWRKGWQDRTGNTSDGDFGDYLYDFYPEYLM